MTTVILLLGNLLYYILAGVLVLFLIRVISSWMMLEPESGLLYFVYTVTEFFVAPVRILLDRFEWVQQSPLDISFFAASLLIVFMQSLLMGVI